MRLKQLTYSLGLLIALTSHLLAEPPCGTVPYPTTYDTPDPILHSSQVWSFVSKPHLHPMKITVNVHKSGVNPGYVFVAPYSFSSVPTYGQGGSLILTHDGDPIWFRPLKTNLMNTDFRVQTLYGKPVLTFWQGTLATPPAYTNAPGGSSEPGSCYYILDDTYQIIHTVSAQNGFTSDIHEFLLTPKNTALLLSTKTVPMDLTPYGGPADGYVQNFAVQEIDLKTNELVFFWDALQHIPLTDSYEPASSASSTDNIWDAFHLNSIGLTNHSKEILVSGRNLWTVYKINKKTGNIVWQLGGKNSSFQVDESAAFSWQHDARSLSHDKISLFDDNCCESTTPPGTPPSHGLIIKLNFEKMTAKRDKAYYHNPNITVSSQGNVQSLPNGNKFIGWGQSSYFSEFTYAGNTAHHPGKNLIYDAQMPGSNYTYRAYSHEWVGTPHYPPSIAVKSRHEGRVAVYASWNGSTQTRSWEVFAGTAKHCLHKVACKKKSGFETKISVDNPGPYFQVKALDAAHQVIGSSKIVHR